MQPLELHYIKTKKRVVIVICAIILMLSTGCVYDEKPNPTQDSMMHSPADSVPIDSHIPDTATYSFCGYVSHICEKSGIPSITVFSTWHSKASAVNLYIHLGHTALVRLPDNRYLSEFSVGDAVRVIVSYKTGDIIDGNWEPPNVKADSIEIIYTAEELAEHRANTTFEEISLTALVINAQYDGGYGGTSANIIAQVTECNEHSNFALGDIVLVEIPSNMSTDDFKKSSTIHVVYDEYMHDNFVVDCEFRSPIIPKIINIVPNYVS